MKTKAYPGYFSSIFWRLIILFLILFILFSCSPGNKIEKRFSYMRIIKVDSVKEGYWVFFRDKIGVYKSFQFEKPDSLWPGKIVKLPKVYKVNRYF